MKPKPDLSILPIADLRRRRLLMLDGALLLGVAVLATPALAIASMPSLRAVTLLAPMFGMQRVGEFLPLESKPAWLHYASRSYDAALAGQLAAALQRLRAAGTIAAIVERYAGDVAKIGKR